MRKTNVDKWNEVSAMLETKKQHYLDDYFLHNERPTCFYLATMKEIETIPVNDIYVWIAGEPFYHTKPTKKEIQKLQTFVDEFDEREKNILISYKKVTGTFVISSSKSISSIEDDNRTSFDYDELIPIQKELDEKFSPREGYTACSYCKIQTPTEKMVDYTIIFQNSKPHPFNRTGWKKFVDRKTLKYCSEQCGIHDQMAHEG